MKYKAEFHVSCYATYPAELDLPDKFFNEKGELIVSADEVIDYLNDNLSNISAGELEWVDDSER